MFKKLNLFSKTEMKLLVFMSTRDGELYERQIAKEAKVSTGSVNSIMKDFGRLGLVIRTKKGRMLFYARNDRSALLRQFRIFMTLNNLRAVMEKIVPLSRRIILFGSCAEGRNGEKSDIDLFILSREKEAIRRALDAYPGIQAIVLDSSEYANLQQKDKPLYDRIQRGIELRGEEDG